MSFGLGGNLGKHNDIMQTENCKDQVQGSIPGSRCFEVTVGLFFYLRLIQKHILMDQFRAPKQRQCFVFLGKKIGREQWQPREWYVQVEKCVRSDRWRKGSFWCQSEAEKQRAANHSLNNLLDKHLSQANAYWSPLVRQNWDMLAWIHSEENKPLQYINT